MAECASLFRPTSAGEQEASMVKFDHLGIPVRNEVASRDWYVDVVGLSVEFEIPDRGVVAVADGNGFSILLHRATAPSAPGEFGFWFQVDDVHASYDALSRRGIPFTAPPQKLGWGYGAELLDLDGYRVCLWDEKSMNAHS
jgi:catechol 2,3-dioxygenase-like lactoylglutathione lyase family enzyme